MVRKAVIVFLFLLLTALIRAVFLAGYYGFIPFLSSQFEPFTVVDLGVRSTEEDWSRVRGKSGVSFSSLARGVPIQKSMSLEGMHLVDTSFTGEELTSLLLHDRWRYNFMKDSEVRIGQSGTVEIAGQWNVGRQYGFSKSHSDSSELGLLFLRLFHEKNLKLPFYIKFTGRFEEGKLTINTEEFFFGRYRASQDWLGSHQGSITSVVQDHLLHHSEVKIESISFSDGRMQYRGTLPDVIAVEPE